MNAHTVIDACGFITALTTLHLGAERRHWKRFARVMENRMLDARMHAGDLQHANEALRRANEILQEKWRRSG